MTTYATPAQVSTTHRCIIKPGYSSVSGHKRIRDHVITRQKPLQNDFLTQHIRNINISCSKILESRITEYAESEGTHQDL